MQTAWVVITLLHAKYPHKDRIKRAVKVIMDRQLPDGSWAQEQIEGIFNRNCKYHTAARRGCRGRTCPLTLTLLHDLTMNRCDFVSKLQVQLYHLGAWQGRTRAGLELTTRTPNCCIFALCAFPMIPLFNESPSCCDMKCHDGLVCAGASASRGSS